MAGGGAIEGRGGGEGGEPPARRGGRGGGGGRGRQRVPRYPREGGKGARQGSIAIIMEGRLGPLALPGAATGDGCLA